VSAAQFHVISEVADVGQAFAAEVAKAQFQYGHSGYTGTIAEKDGFEVFAKPAGYSVEEVIAALEEQRTSKLAELLPADIWDAYEDKWGSAIAMQDDDGRWHFFGYAAS
jgi:hypothetical protein